MATVVLLGTLDTKGREYGYVRDTLENEGCHVVLINAGPLADPDYDVDYTREDVAGEAGVSLADLVETADRGEAVRVMSRGAGAIVERLHEDGRLHGILGMGGSGGSSLIGSAMQRLPVGVPKLLVSTMGAGNVASFVGASDIAVMYSVVDIAGINQVTTRVFSNAAHAMAGMVKGLDDQRRVTSGRPVLGATMYGTTTPCVTRAVSELEERGYEVLVFHATGAGGRSMETLIRGGQIIGVLDITTAELMAEVAGGTFTAGPDRLEAAGSMGLPQVVSVGGVDQIAFSPPDTVPERYRSRNLYSHNQSITLMRSNRAEVEEYAWRLAERLNDAAGPVALFLPLQGTSAYAIEGGVFHDPDADRSLFDTLRARVADHVEVIEIEADINAPTFASALADKLDQLCRFRAEVGP